MIGIDIQYSPVANAIIHSMSQENLNELHPELLGIGSDLNSYAGFDASSRQQMFCSHLGQSLVISGSEPRRLQTGAERELGKATKKIVMPCNALILKVLQKYPRVMGQNRAKENPETTIIYEDRDTYQIGSINVPRYHCIHTRFGFKFKRNTALKKVVPKAFIPKGTVLVDSPAIDEHGDYGYGVEAKIANISIPQITEDGFVARRGFLKKLQVDVIESRVGMWGKEYYALNLYGDENNYKPFPDIGDRIRPDGLLFALRPYSEKFGAVDMTPKALMTPDPVYDKLTYGEPNAIVYDITVNHDQTQNNPPTPVGMEKQPQDYFQSHKKFYNELISFYRYMSKQRGENLKLQPELHRMIVEALGSDPKAVPYKVRNIYRLVPIDDWRVEIKYVKKFTPTIGYKLTDCHGAKGVIVDIWEDEDMPTNEFGEVADLIIDGNSITKRLNAGQLYEQYINATGSMVQRHMNERCGGDKLKLDVDKEFDNLLKLYNIVSPEMAMITLKMGVDPLRRKEHVYSVLKDGVYWYLPPNSRNIGPKQISAKHGGLAKHFPLEYGPITYRGRSGNKCTTVNPVIIGSKYVMLLEAIPDNYSAVSTSQLSHFGIPARLTIKDKNSTPVREQPVRFGGESETRLTNAACGPDAMADTIDASNNPLVHKEIVKNILKADRPTNIDVVVDREKFPLGNARPIAYVSHILECAGITFEHYEYDHHSPSTMR